MKTRFRFIHFERDDNLFGDVVWHCINNRHSTSLGLVMFDEEWKQWVFSGSETAIFSADCLRDIATFLVGLSQ